MSYSMFFLWVNVLEKRISNALLTFILIAGWKFKMPSHENAKLSFKH